MVLAGDSGVLCSVLLDWKVDSYSGGYIWILFAVSVLVSIVSVFLFPQGHGSMFHTHWHYVCHFSVMVMGAMVFMYREKISSGKLWVDLLLLAVSFIAYFAIVAVGKSATDWRWYTQLAALVPLHSFCYFGYKVCMHGWCGKLMTHGIWRWPIGWIASLTLEIYVVQFHVITDRFNALFPLNWFIVFGLVCVTAYLLRVIVNAFLQFMGKDPWLWRQCLRI